MADRNGKAIAAGTDYAVIGEALATSGGRVMLRVGNNVIQPDEADVAQAVDLRFPQLDHYWFGRVQTSTGNHLIGPGGGGAHSIPSPVMRAGSTSYVSLTAYQNTYSGTPPFPTPVFYLELRWRASATRSTEGSVIAKTGTITFDWTAVATNVPQRLKWLNPSTGADDVAPLSLAQLDSIYLDLVGDTSMAWGVSCYVEVDINA